MNLLQARQTPVPFKLKSKPLSIVGLCLTMIVSVAAHAQCMQDLGTLGGATGTAYGISADGSVVVGAAAIANGQGHAFRWIELGGMLDLGTLGGTTSIATAVSADGQIVVGTSTLANGQSRAFRWTPTEGMQDLGTLGGASSSAAAISADGSVIVGTASVSGTANTDRAFRWTMAEGMQSLGTIANQRSRGMGISADGTIIVGTDFVPPQGGGFGNNVPFVWTASAGLQYLAGSNGIGADKVAISGNGLTIVGTFSDPIGWHSTAAFTWTQSAGIRTLPFPFENTYGTYANGVSFDGSIAVGSSHTTSGNFYGQFWPSQPSHAYGIGTFGGRNSYSYAVSADSRFIVGEASTAAQNVHPFRLRWSVIGDYDGDGTIQYPDYLVFVANFSAGQMRADVNHDGVLDMFDYLDFIDGFSCSYF